MLVQRMICTLLLLVLSSIGALAQTTATWTGAGTNDFYSNPDNWDLGGSVPIDNGTTYDVIIPDEEMVLFDVGGSSQIQSLDIGTEGSFTLMGSTGLTVVDEAILGGYISTVGVGFGLSATGPGSLLLDAAQLAATSGNSISSSATVYIYDDGDLTATVFSSDGAGSLVDLSSLATYTDLKTNVASGVRTIRASNGGTIDLSALQILSGGKGNDEIAFEIVSGGGIDLSNLVSTIETVRFNVDVPVFSLPSLLTGSETIFDLEANRLEAPLLEGLFFADVSMDAGGEFDAPNLRRFDAGTLTLVLGATFTSAALDTIDGSQIMVVGGATGPLITDQDYRYTQGDLPLTADVFVAEGAGSSLDLSSFTSYYDGRTNAASGTRTIRASDGGFIDLSNLATMSGGLGNDIVEFVIASGGDIDLDGLETSVEAVRFDVDVPNYTLAGLTEASETIFDLGGNAIHLPVLGSLEFGSVILTAGDLFDAPVLNRVVASDLEIPLGASFSTAILDIIDGSQVAVLGGATGPTITDPEYTYDISGLPLNAVVFSADGVGSTLDLTSVTNYVDGLSTTASGVRTIRASNSGLVDLSELTHMSGGIGNDEVEFEVATGGDILLDALETTVETVRFDVDVPDYTIPVLARSEEPIFDPQENTIHTPVLESVEFARFEIAPGGLFDAPILHRFVGSVIDLAPGVGFTTASLDTIDGSQFSVSGGVSGPVIIDNEYVYGISGLPLYADVFSADGAGSLLDLTSLTSYADEISRVPAGIRTIRASNDGVVDLSELTYLDGGEGNDEVEIDVSTGGNVLLDALTRSDEFVRYDINVPDYTIPVLARSTFPIFDLEGSTIHTPLLESVEFASYEIDPGGLFDAPILHRFVASSIDIAPGVGFVTAALDTIDASRFSVSGGVSGPTITDTDYVYGGVPDLPLDVDVFAADGAGSILDLTSLTTFEDTVDRVAAGTRVIRVSNDGAIDLSNLVSLSGGIGNDVVEIEVGAGGNLALDALAVSERVVLYDINEATYTLPSLSRASESIFDIQGNTLNTPSLQSVELAGFEIASGGLFDAPALHRFVGSSMDLSPGIGFVTATLDTIDGSLIFISGGVAGPTITDVDYLYNTVDFGLTTDVFVADGSGSALDLSTLTRYIDSVGTTASGQRTIRASDTGELDFSGVRELEGPPGNDELDIIAETGGLIDFSSVLEHAGNIHFDADAAGSRILFGFLDLVDSENTLSITNSADLIVGKGLTFDHEDDSDIELTEARITFEATVDPSCSQVLEVASEDLGVGGPSSGNFEIGRLVIGTDLGAGVLQLVDWHDNGNRGDGVEALYLIGLDGDDGLSLLNGSTLIIPVDVNVYTNIGGAMTHLNQLFDGDDTIAFDDGFLQLSRSIVDAPDLDGPPLRLALHSVFPNPVVDAVTVRFQVPKSMEIDLSVFDVQGRRVVALGQGIYAPGDHAIEWNSRSTAGRTVPAGVYFARLATPEGVRQRRLVLVR